jgi:hypothetical protein
MRYSTGFLAVFNCLEVPGAGECVEASVVCFFGFGREAAGGEFVVSQVRLEALAAEAFLAAGICAVAEFEVFFFLAFHFKFLFIRVTVFWLSYYFFWGS